MFSVGQTMAEDRREKKSFFPEICEIIAQSAKLCALFAPAKS
jgi:hypothetical protein|tara:strand:- start:82452 stop:82577 length:126 start_codon:yes stop_codon:yes gene_type:complete